MPKAGKYKYNYKYSRPSVAADICVFTIRDGKLCIVLVERNEEPHGWAVPGGFLTEKETLEDCAERELKQETGIECEELFHFKNYSHPKRDKRQRTISVAYFALIPRIPHDVIKATAGSDAKNAWVWPVSDVPQGIPGKKQAFGDHHIIINDGFNALKDKVVKDNLLLEVLHQEVMREKKAARPELYEGNLLLNAMPKGGFTLPELYEAYKAVEFYKVYEKEDELKEEEKKKWDPANFTRYVKRTLIETGVIKETGGKKKSGDGRMGPPTKLYIRSNV